MRIKTFILFAFFLAISEGALAVGSSYAVFKISYSKEGGAAVGGVAGTAFFVSNQKAITACHVLNEKSFEPATGFKKTRIWLVHENEKPIELFRKNIILNCAHDETNIHFEKPVVDSKFVFEKSTGISPNSNAEVETEGFIANTAGPQMNWKDGEVEITSVPKLEKVKSKGVLLRNVKIDLNAKDLKLVQTNSIQVSYKPIVGISGGPVTINGQFVAFNSFADPASKATTWAVLIN